jgi:hypothetical protein
MRTTWRGGAFALIGLGIALNGGCGGSGSGSASALTDATRGALTLKVTFPPTRAVTAKQKTRAFAGNIPLGSRSIQVTLTNPTTGLQAAPPRLVAAPTTTSGTLPAQITIQYALLPPGPIRADATVFPDSTGEEHPLATGSVSGQILPQSTTRLTVNFTLTLAHFSVAPVRVILTPIPGPGHTTTLTASATDESDRLLRYPLFWLSRDPGIANVTFDPNSPETATVTGVAEGATVITVVEPNSGMTATVDVTVHQGT